MSFYRRFQMLKIGKNYEPQMSEWIIAMVKDVEDLDVTLHVLGKRWAVKFNKTGNSLSKLIFSWQRRNILS